VFTPVDWRVVDEPAIITSRGTTRILLPGPGVLSGSRSTPSDKGSEDKKSHEAGRSFGVVYVNSIARETMSAGPPGEFPRGSIIVREKLATTDNTKPQLLAAMIKRARGFNPAANDWEFLVIDGAMTKVRMRQKKGACLNCHVSQKARDYVYPENIPYPQN
jgi:hypothetical protein